MSLIPEKMKGAAYAVTLLPAAFAEWLLGPRCDLCSQRVYPKDAPSHVRTDHAGDTR